MVSVSSLGTGYGNYGFDPYGFSTWATGGQLPFAAQTANPYASAYDFGTTYGSSSGLSPFVQNFLGAQNNALTCCPNGQGGQNAMMEQQLLEMLLELAIMLAVMQMMNGNGRDLGALSSGGFGSGNKVSPASWGGSGGGSSGSSSSSGGGSPRAGGTASVPSNMPTGRGTSGDFLKAALAQNGDRYVYGAETNLNDKNPNTFDCSELVQWAAAQAGVNIPDGSSNQRAYCRQHGKEISVEEAIRTPGALLFKDGHVAISLGDGRTIEAMGSKWGVCIGNARGRFTSGGLIPGMSY